MQPFFTRLFGVVSFVCFLSCIKTQAQLMTGITHKPDTSYTNYSAYKYEKPYHPNIELVTGFNFKDVEVKKNLTYHSYGKRLLVTDVFLPKQSNEKSIAIIMIHGGGWRSGNRTQHHPMAESLAHVGYVCFTPEYRLSTEALFPAAVYDIKAVIRWVKENDSAYNVDTSKIVVAGFSAGGELASFMATTGNMPLFDGTQGNSRFSTSVKALIDIDGTLSFVHPESVEGVDTIGRISAGTYWFGFGKKQNYGLWLAASPLTYADGRTPPTLFLNSSVARMHAGRNDFIKVLDSFGIYTEVHEFDDAPHSFPLFYPWFDPMIKYMDEFLKKIFRNDEHKN
jgi:pectinesterase